MRRECRICNSKFDYCAQCMLIKNPFKEAGYCGEDCYHISMILQKYGSKMATATETIKKGIAVRALSGARDVDNVANNALSDVFIVNDRSAQMVRVYSTRDLIDRIWGDIDRYANVKGMPAGRIPMSWFGDSPDQGAAEDRIANLLANVHAFKISMALKPSTF